MEVATGVVTALNVGPHNRGLLVWGPCLLAGPPLSFVFFEEQGFGSAGSERATGLRGAGQRGQRGQPARPPGLPVVTPARP